MHRSSTPTVRPRSVRSGILRAPWTALVALSVALVACPSSPYRCDGSHACASPAICAPTGYCAAPAPECASGLRYTTSAAEPGACAPSDAAGDATLDATADATADAPSEAVVDAPEDSADAPDDAVDEAALDASDAPDPMDALDAADAFDAPDGSDASTDAQDAPADRVADAADASDAPAARDVADAPDASDAATDGRCSVAPRPLSPIAGTRFGASSVALTWRNVTPGTGAEVQIARDPAFTSIVAALSGGGVGDSRVVFGALARGVYFWRARDTCGTGVDASPWSATWSFWASGVGTSGAQLGWVRDLNGDGRADFVVGAPRSPVTYPGGRTVDVYFGTSGSTPFGGAATQTLTGSTDGFGSAVAIVPDMNGDGRAELAVSSCRRGGGVCTPTVTVFTLSVDARTFRVLATYALGDASQRFGADLAGVGDVDGDGYGDLLVAAPGTYPTPAGLLYTVRGGVTLPTVPEPLALDPAPTDTPAVTLFGWSVAGVGDVNADGHPDALVTSFQRAWIYPGRGVGGSLFAAPILLQRTAVEEGTYGFVASAAGDMNGDGAADFALARPGATGGLGDVAVFYGANDLASGRAPDYTLTGPTAGGRFGQSLAGGGNVAGALDDDLVVGAPGANGGLGEAYALLDRRSAVSSRLALFGGATNAVTGLGRAASVIGDFDGDGLDEFAVGAGADVASSTGLQSAVYLWRGSATTAPVASVGNVVNGTSDYGRSLGER